ncbi:MAG: MIT C-terminal domain-containing protein, partial [Bacteroidota bacterium]
TLEYLTHLGEGESDKIVKDEDKRREGEKADNEEQPQKRTHQKNIFENQTGISYRKLFGKYLKGATEIEIEDPYIRYHYQFKNFMEFCSMLADIKSEGEEIKLTLKTSNEKENIEDASKAFEEIKDSLESLGIFLEYQFKENAHDRFNIADTGWKILLGRGLDIFQKTDNAYDLAGIYQEKRKCKQTEITYLPNN